MLGIEGKERQGGSKTDGADERPLPLRFFSTFQTSVFPLNPISASCWPLLPPLILIGSTQPPFSHNKRKKETKISRKSGKSNFPSSVVAASSAGGRDDKEGWSSFPFFGSLIKPCWTFSAERYFLAGPCGSK